MRSCLTLVVSVFALSTSSLYTSVAISAESTAVNDSASVQTSSIPDVNVPSNLKDFCLTKLKQLPGQIKQDSLELLCNQVQRSSNCTSVQQAPIFHFNKTGALNQAMRILVLAVIHGDEPASGTLARGWMERLNDISPRNSWRILPILNPDGLDRNQRTNYTGVDLNRNFPTQDWLDTAHSYWAEKAEKNPRRFPGSRPASEPETNCAIAHIQEYQPHLIVSIHTPYGVLDLDGPRKNLPKSPFLPWNFLGHFPGSLGRYMWFDHKVPVLTIELKGEHSTEVLEHLDQMQDLVGKLALQLPTANPHTTTAKQ